MKNIHILPTDKSSRLWLNNLLQGKLELSEEELPYNTAQNIYITNDEEIKEGWKGYAYKEDVKSKVFKHFYTTNEWYKDAKKIILTTDPKLIADGVQSIDNEFLEWFMNNPNCENVEVRYCKGVTMDGNSICKIIIPIETQDDIVKNYLGDELKKYENVKTIIFNKPEEPKQETLEEVAERLYSDKLYPMYGSIRRDAFINGAKWQQERSYSEEEAYKIWKAGQEYWKTSGTSITFEELIEQLKKK